MVFLGWGLRWMQLTAVAVCFGSLVFTWIGPAGAQWLTRVRRAQRWLAALAVVAGALELPVHVAIAGDRYSALVRPADWFQFACMTRIGALWLLREAFALLLLAGYSTSPQGGWLAAAGAATCAISSIAWLVIAGLAGHASSIEPVAIGLTTHVFHVLAVAAWLGGLGALALLARWAVRNDSTHATWDVIGALRRFSRLASVCMLAIAASGVTAAFLQVGTWPALLGTTYGQLLLMKLLALTGALSLAATIRWRLMPAARGDAGDPWVGRVRQLVVLETAFAFAITALACGMGSVTPARHDPVQWWLPFRLSVDATWSADPVLRYGGCLLVVGTIALCVLALWRLRRRCRVRLVLAGAVLTGAGGVGVLAVPAYPETYTRPTVRYEAVSIAHGARVFVERCVGCHGAGGRGDGPLASRLPRRPANLTEPHTALHTAGDMYAWLSRGIPRGAMPGFRDVLTEDDRWDVVNFLRAFSEGFQARLLRDEVVPLHPWLGAPDFNYRDATGQAARLSGLRGHRSALLVFYQWPRARARLASLSAERSRLQDADAEIILVPVGAYASAGPQDESVVRELSRATEEADDIVAAYALMARTLDRPGERVLEAPPWHLELVIDRFGYVRSRWCSTDDRDSPVGFPLGALVRQLMQLRSEPQVLPPPDAHVH
jgi:putative copper resistance protein D